MIEDRGNAVGAMRSSTFCGMVMRSSASLASSPLSIVTGPTQARPVSRRRREHMRADRLVRIADRDRNLNGRIEHLAPVRQRFMRVAPHVKLLRRAADVD